MKATIVTVGDELLVGQVVDTNASWLAESLSSLGIRVVRMTSVGDDRAEIVRVLLDLRVISDVVVVTGGLGPTHDDLTRFAVSEVMKADLEFRPELLDRIVQRFRQFGKEAPDSNRVQAMIPRGMEVLPNPIGSAVGFSGEMPGSSGARVFVLPGVPLEMRKMFTDQVRPVLEKMDGRLCVTRRTLVTAGIGESHLQERLQGLVDLASDGVELAYLPSLGSVRLRISVTRTTEAESVSDSGRLVAEVVRRLSHCVVSEHGEEMEVVLSAMLSENGKTLSVAESCTAGRVMDLITQVSGASSYVVGGVVAYSNAVKREVLGVPAAILSEHGAVSEAVATAMAEGVRGLIGSDLGVSTTGIMGPTGGTESKPVGSLCIAVADVDGAVVRSLRLGGDREQNKQRAAVAALDLVRLRLLGAV